MLMGPTCEILLEVDDQPTLDAIDKILVSAADRIDRTRKGRVWDVWIRSRPVHVDVSRPPPVVTLSAGCNTSEDFAVLRELAASIVEVVGGIASEPEK
jgi:IS4 transposase